MLSQRFPTNETSSWMLIKASKTFNQPFNVAETHAILSWDFRKVLHKPLTLNGGDR